MEQGIWLSFEAFRALSLEDIEEGGQSFRANRWMLMFRLGNDLEKGLDASRNDLKVLF